MSEHELSTGIPSYEQLSVAFEERASAAAADFVDSYTPYGLTQYTESIVASSLLELANMAIDAGDEPLALERTQQAMTFQKGGREAWVVARLYANNLGDNRAIFELEAMLQRERKRLSGTLPDRKAHSPFHPFPEGQYLLDAIVAHSAKQGTPAEGWIDRFGLNEIHKFSLRLDYLTDLYDSKSPEALGLAAITQQAVVDAILVDSKLPPGTMVTNMEQLLYQVSDPAIREQLFHHLDMFMPSSMSPEQAMFLLHTITELGAYLLDDPSWATNQRVDGLNNFIRNLTEALAAHHMLRTDLEHAQVGWHIALAERAAASPEQLITRIDDIWRGITDTQKRENYPDELRTSREEWLLTYAERYMYAGDLEAAGTLLRSLENHNSYINLISEHYEAIRTSENAKAVRPNELAMLVYPELQATADRLELLTSGDIGMLEEHARTIASSGVEDDDFLTALLSRVLRADQARGVELTQEIITSLYDRPDQDPAVLQKLTSNMLEYCDSPHVYEWLLDNPFTSASPLLSLTHNLQLAQATRRIAREEFFF